MEKHESNRVESITAKEVNKIFKKFKKIVRHVFIILFPAAACRWRTARSIRSLDARPCGETEEFWQSPARIKRPPQKTPSVGTIFQPILLVPRTTILLPLSSAERGQIICGIHASAVEIVHRIIRAPRINAKFRSHPVHFCVAG